MPIPEGFIMPTLGTSVGGNVLKALPSAEAISGALGTQTAEIVRHREFNALRTQVLQETGAFGEMTDEIELVIITNDKYTKVPLRASNLSDPTKPFCNELSIPQQIQLADLRERFRKNEHGSETPVGLWDALNSGEKHRLIAMGILYVEQLAAYQEHELYKLGNGGRELVDRAKRHVAGKKPNIQEEVEKNMAALLEAKMAESERAAELERKYLELQERLAAMEAGSPKRGKAPKPGIQEEEAA